ncbi:DinB family protein [Amycolatopsis benzoatilytica]|uniref:DinB family protein n=1 Tax=Amycolatopsis benzoatilytica TaxID=346045 RepID=UPI000363470C|nr:DinB family protein [Amycolatopsis benzoatilytica]
MDRQELHDELDRTRRDFHALLAGADRAALRRSTAGTRWTNRQLLFHLLLGFLIVRALRNLVRFFGRLPDSASRRFAWLLDVASAPFDVVNFAGSWLAGTILPRRWMLALFDRTIAALHRRIDAESDADLARGMAYPTRWDPCFREYMTLADIYRFPVQHYDVHRRQLTLPGLGG